MHVEVNKGNLVEETAITFYNNSNFIVDYENGVSSQINKDMI